MSERSQTLRELRERLQRKLAEGIPDAPSKAEIARREYEEAKRANCEVLELIPGKGGRVGKRWQPYVDKTSSYRQVDQTALDEAWELQRRVAEAARRARMRADPLNLYGGGEETIDDIVRRQDETR
jgi:hypothetical protein